MTLYVDHKHVFRLHLLPPSKATVQGRCPARGRILAGLCRAWRIAPKVNSENLTPINPPASKFQGINIQVYAVGAEKDLN